MVLERRGSVSRACLHCQCHEQRLRRGFKASLRPGSRMRTPWALGSKRGLPQFTHRLQHTPCCWRPGPGALACRPPWNGESAPCRPKPLRSVMPPPGPRPDAARLRAFHRFFPTYVATGLEPGAEHSSPPSRPRGMARHAVMSSRPILPFAPPSRHRWRHAPQHEG